MIFHLTVMAHLEEGHWLHQYNLPVQTTVHYTKILARVCGIVLPLQFCYTKFAGSPSLDIIIDTEANYLHTRTCALSQSVNSTKPHLKSR